MSLRYILKDVIVWRVCKVPRFAGPKRQLRLAEPAEDDEGFVLRKKKGRHPLWVTPLRLVLRKAMPSRWPGGTLS